MKMSDYFGFGSISSYGDVVCVVGEEDICIMESPEKAKAVAHAIDSHDRLVEMLKSARSSLIASYDYSDYPGGMESEQGVVADQIDKLIKELNK